MADQQATPQLVAQATSDAMWPHDRATQWLAIERIAIGPGTATMRMAVQPHMLNGHGTCHGGLITTLADSAFAFACNTYNDVTVAAGFDVNLIAAPRAGDVLTATATEVAKTRRTGIYDVDVRDQNGRRIATFRGRSQTLPGKLIVPTLPSTRGI